MARLRNHFFVVKKTTSNTYSECVSVALFIQHANRMRQTLLLAVFCLTAQYFIHYLINGTIFGEKKNFTGHKMCL